MSESFYTKVDQVFADWNYQSPRIIHSFLRALKPEVHVEVGVYRGLSTAWAAQAMRENGKGRVVGIDNFSLTEHVARYGDPRAHMQANLDALGVSDLVEIRQGETSDPAMWPEHCSSAYIDAWHSYEAAKTDFFMAYTRGAKLICLDDTENCVGPRMLVEWLRGELSDDFDIIDLHSDNGLTIFLKKQPRRLITFSQELPYPCAGVDLRPLTLEQQKEHFDAAAAITGRDYSGLYNQTEHDMKV